MDNTCSLHHLCIRIPDAPIDTQHPTSQLCDCQIRDRKYLSFVNACLCLDHYLVGFSTVTEKGPYNTFWGHTCYLSKIRQIKSAHLFTGHRVWDYLHSQLLSNLQPAYFLKPQKCFLFHTKFYPPISFRKQADANTKTLYTGTSSERRRLQTFF